MRNQRSFELEIYIFFIYNLAMETRANNNIYFGSIYYSKYSILPQNLKYINPSKDKFLIEQKPLETAKEIMKESPLFRDLDNLKTDVFVYMDVKPLSKADPAGNNLLGTLYSTFVNPYNKKPEALIINSSGLNADTILNKIKHVTKKLPLCNNLKADFWGKPSIHKTADEWWIWIDGTK